MLQSPHVLQQVARAVTQLTHLQIQSNIAASAAILAKLALEKELLDFSNLADLVNWLQDHPGG